MSTHKFTHTQFSIILLILIYLVGTLLPATKVTAAGQPRNCNEANPLMASVAASTALDATQQVVIPKFVVDYAAFEATWRTRYKDSDAVRGIIMTELLANMELIPDGDKLFNILNDWQIRFEQAVIRAEMTDRTLLPYEAIIHMGLDEALKTPEMASAVPIVWDKITSTQYLGQQGLTDTARIVQSGNRYDLGARVLELAPQTALTVFDCAQKNSAIAAVFDALNSDKLNGSITDNAETLLGNNPDVPVPAEIRGRINRDGTVSFSLDELKGITAEEFEKIHTSIDEIQETLTEIDAKQDVIIDYIKDQELRAKHQELIKKKAAAHQLKIDAAKASVSILSTLIGAIDQKTGKQVSTIGASTIQVAEAMNTWLKSVSGFSDVFSLNSIVMSGSVLDAVMKVVALFGEQEPTPEQMILEEIGKLRQQVDQLRLEMHDRFDRIDEGLNAIFTTMNDRFNQIDIQLGQINGNVRDLQQSLLTLDVKLSRIERNNFELINAVGRRPLLDAINLGLGYLRRTGEEMPYQPDFVNFEGILHGWGTIHAFDAGNVGPTQRDYSDAGLYTELSAYPLDVNLNYLNGWLMTHGLQPLSDRQLASPRDWLFASRAYTQLGIEWPEHMAQVDPEQQATLDQVGFELEKAMRNISTIQTANGPQGNTVLISTVITHYQNKLDQLASAIQGVETTFINEKRALELQRTEPISLYAGIDQPLTFLPPEFTTMTCNDLSLPAPSHLRSVIPNFDRYNLAEYLRLGKMNVCVHYEEGDYSDHCYTEPEPPYAEICDRYYQNKAVLSVYFDNLLIMSQSVQSGGGYLHPDWAFHYEKVANHWTEGDNYKASFEAMTTVDTPTPEQAAQRAELLNTVTGKVETMLGNYQHQMYQRILHEMTAGSLQSKATEVAGSKMLLDSFITLGFQRALSSDEFLHAMLYGEQQLVEDGQIMQSYAFSLTQPISETNLLVNPRLVIAATADERTDAFTEMIDTHLDAITAKTHTEAPDYIASIRRALDLTMRIAEVAATQSPVTPTPPVTPTTPTPPVTPQPGVTPTPSGPQSPDPKDVYMPMIDR